MAIIDIKELTALVDARVESRLAALGVNATEFTTGVRPPRLPAGVTPRTYDRWCREGRVEGAAHDGSGWRCTAAAWRAARAKGPTRAATTRAPIIDDADALLAQAGLRATARQGT